MIELKVNWLRNRQPTSTLQGGIPIKAWSSLRQSRGYNGRYKWEVAVQSELTALATFDTFEVVDLPPGKKHVGCKYVFKIKHLDGSIEKY